MLKQTRRLIEEISETVLSNRNRVDFIAICLMALFLVVVLPSSPIFAAQKTQSNASPTTTAKNTSQNHETLSKVEAKWGIKLLHLRLTAGGHLLDLRYKVIDPAKAGEILKKKSKAYLTDQKTGKTVTVPITKAGPMRQTTLNPQANRIYFTLFTNSGGLLKEGSKVTVTMGEFKMENVVVEESGANRPPLETMMPKLTETQQKKWGAVKPVQQVLLRELQVCGEHCSGNKDCLDRCEKAFGVRLEREYQRLTQ
jgi:hypothetical protein